MAAQLRSSRLGRMPGASGRTTPIRPPRPKPRRLSAANDKARRPRASRLPVRKPPIPAGERSRRRRRKARRIRLRCLPPLRRALGQPVRQIVRKSPQPILVPRAIRTDMPPAAATGSREIVTGTRAAKRITRSEPARLTGANCETIRYFERLGVLGRPSETMNGT